MDNNIEVKRKLILVRHGESADKQPGQSDFDRVLTLKGKISIELLGKFFKRDKLKLNSVISSPAMRARETSIILSHAIEFLSEKIQFEASLYDGTDQDYLDVISNSMPSLMIVGHNPAISNLIGNATGDYSTALLPGQSAVLEIDDGVDPKRIKQSIQLIGPFHK